MGAGRKLRVHTLKHEHEAERKWEVALNFKAHSQRHSFSSKAMPPKTPQTVPSVGDKYSNSWGGGILTQNTAKPSEFIDRSHPDQFSTQTHHTENMGHTLHGRSHLHHNTDHTQNM